ncbi:hypothetical protein [Actinomadura oligospora]|uniref:hypothetical protein n=1 Tax=Actinomadura oligospora TaxID=111804 RepID=UPI0004BCF270|nr:hypothetical protein [Actinomadura oligospora]
MSEADLVPPPAPRPGTGIGEGADAGTGAGRRTIGHPPTTAPAPHREHGNIPL